MDLNYSIPASGYNPLRFDPNMIANQLATYQQGQNNQNQPAYQMKKELQFGPNYSHIAMSNAIQGIGAFLRGRNQVNDFKSYNKVQQNPLLQLPQNPNTSQQSQYGMDQFKKGGKKMAEGGMADFDDFDEEDFQDLKGQMDKYFSEKGSTPEVPNTDQEDKEEEKPQEEQGQDEPMTHAALNFLNTPQEDEPEEEPKPDETDDTQINEPPISLSGKNNPDQSTDPLVESFKRGIAKVENAGYNEGNKNSSAFGKYQFTSATREGVREQFFKNINKKDFETAYKEDPKFQEKVMDVYGSHLLHQFNGNVHEAAIAHFLGPGKANMYTQPNYNPGGGNVSVGKYLNTFDKGYGQRRGGQIYAEGGVTNTNGPEPNGPIGFLNSYYSSPEFHQRMNWINGGNQDEYKKQMDYIKSGEDNYKPFVIPSGHPTLGSSALHYPENVGDNRDVRNSFRFDDDDKKPDSDISTLLSLPQSKQIGANLYREVVPHEYTHNTRGLSPDEEEKITSLSKNSDKALKTYNDQKPIAQSLYNLKNRGQDPDKPKYDVFSDLSETTNHDFSPNEKYADLNALRFMMWRNNIYDTRKGDMKIEDLQKAMKNPEIKDSFIMKRMLQNFNPDDIVRFNNTIASNNSQESNQAKRGGYIMDEGGGIGPGDSKKQQVPNKPTAADSLALYNNAKQVAAYYNNSDYSVETTSTNVKNFDRDNRAAYISFIGNEDGNLTENGLRKIKPDEYRKDIDNNRYYQREQLYNILDTRAPMTLFDKRIIPQSYTISSNTNSKSNLSGDAIGLYRYDPIAVKPFNMLTPSERTERIQKYGDPTKQQFTPYDITKPHEELTRLMQPQIPNAPRSQVQGPQRAQFNTIQGSPMTPQAPIDPRSNFSFSGMGQDGQQKSLYFNDLDSWRNATEQMGYSHREVTNNGNSASATGYQFKEGGEYNLTNVQIKQLKKMGYDIEVIK